MNLKIQISKFSSAPVLAYPKPWSPFSLSKQNKTASSSLSSPKFLKKRQIKFILLHSFLDPLLLLLLLLKKKKNYSIYDKELFSNHWNLRTMKTTFKKGISIPFPIFSNNRNLLYQKKKKPEKLSRRLVRWALFLIRI